MKSLWVWFGLAFGFGYLLNQIWDRFDLCEVWVSILVQELEFFWCIWVWSCSLGLRWSLTCLLIMQCSNCHQNVHGEDNCYWVLDFIILSSLCSIWKWSFFCILYCNFCKSAWALYGKDFLNLNTYFAFFLC